MSIAEVMERRAQEFVARYQAVREQIGRVIVGHDEIVHGVLTCLFVGGHCLLEGVPGLGKTLLVRTLAKTLNLDFSRIQFTPDLMPADILGTNMVMESPDGRRHFEFQKGPIFTQICLADEINRATPKTQSAMLETMQEFSITAGGNHYKLKLPFFVMATQNPIEQEGTYPLPEAQLDRFFFKLIVGYSDRKQLAAIVDRTTRGENIEPVQVMDGEEIVRWQALIREVILADHVRDYIVRLVLATHPQGPYAPACTNQYLRWGASPRAAQTLALAAKVRALLDARYNVSFEDVRRVTLPAMRHRVIVNFEAQAEGIETDRVLLELLEKVPEKEEQDMARLNRIDINGYRSIKSATLELSSLNVLIGANGAGKSNFVSFFKMLNEMMAGRLQQYIGTTGRAQSLLYLGPKVTLQLEGALEFETETGRDQYSMRMFHAAGDTLIFADETMSFLQTGYLQPRVVTLGAGHLETRIGDEADRNEPTAKALRWLLNRCRVYHFHDTSPTARIRQACYLGDNRWLMPDAGNLAAMLHAYRLKNEVVYRRIVSAVRKIMLDFDDFDLAPSRLNDKDIFLNWRRRGSDYLFGPHQISDGAIRAMAIVTLFLQPEEDLPDVIILDEPELGLHPHALEIVAGLMRSAAVKSQVVVATQSQTFLNSFEPQEIVVVESSRGESQFRRLHQDELRDWLEDFSIGELWQRNVIGGGPLP